MNYAYTSKKKYILEIIVSLLVIVLMVLCFFPCIEINNENWSAETMSYISTITTQDGNPTFVMILGSIILLGVWAKRSMFSCMGMLASIITVGNSISVYSPIVIDEINSNIHYFIMPGDGTYNDIGTPALTMNGYVVIFIPIVVLILYVIHFIREMSRRKKINDPKDEPVSMNHQPSNY